MKGEQKMDKIKSVYQKNDLNLEGDITITLTLEERNIICNALSMLAPKECDIMPLLFLCDRIVRGEQNG